jgi:hypothetical protein
MLKAGHSASLTNEILATNLREINRKQEHAVVDPLPSYQVLIKLLSLLYIVVCMCMLRNCNYSTLAPEKADE